MVGETFNFNYHKITISHSWLLESFELTTKVEENIQGSEEIFKLKETW
jgi:hypothetical protein